MFTHPDPIKGWHIRHDDPLSFDGTKRAIITSLTDCAHHRVKVPWLSETETGFNAQFSRTVEFYMLDGERGQRLSHSADLEQTDD
uniref:Uncharacterized protein n=1 Tax=Sphingomonas sp. NS2 TaxID=908605 RepID=A0A0D4ZY77_9SPHN|nr:hypothetical protein plasmid201_014 [Sphingomonas sp. NS2]